MDARKAAAWALLAAAAQIALALAGHLAYPYLFDALLALAYAFVLPAVAVLHPLHRAHGASGAVLGTIAGTSALLVGIVASHNVDLRPAALVLLGLWWWVIGKTWALAGVLPRPLGRVTAAAGAVAIAAAILESFDTGLAGEIRGWPDLDLWGAARYATAAWLAALATALLRGPGRRTIV